MAAFKTWTYIWLLFGVISNINAIEVRASISPTHIANLLNQLRSGTTLMDPILVWNLVALQANANDYDQSIVSTKDQDGPTATSRAFAIVHGAMHRAMVSFNQAYDHIGLSTDFSSLHSPERTAGMSAAIIEAAYQTLSTLYSQQRPIFTAVYNFHLNLIRRNTTAPTEITMGLSVGHLMAAFMLESRQSDGSKSTETYVPTAVPGYHQVDPTQPTQGYHVSHWGKLKPFFVSSPTRFRLTGTIGTTTLSRALYLNSTTYLNDLLEVKAFGAKTSIERTEDQKRIGIFWAYDGAPKIGTPPRLYNQVARTIAIQQCNTVEQNARLFALINYAMADAGIAAWDTKYFYNFWRPIVGIRQSNSIFHRDTAWVPLGAPGDGAIENFTPAFPAYVSGHAAFGSSVFETLRLFYGRDNIQFSFQSDEYNGITRDSDTGLSRPAQQRYYNTLSTAETENANSRVYLGVHWRSDVVHGQVLGSEVAKEVFRKFSASEHSLYFTV